MDGGVPHCSWGGAACLEGVACLVSWSPSHTAVRQAAVDTTACPSPSCLMQYVVTGRSIITPRCAVHLHVPPCTPGRAAIYIYILLYSWPRDGPRVPTVTRHVRLRVSNSCIACATAIKVYPV